MISTMAIAFSTFRRLLLVHQCDVTPRAQLEAALAQLTESQLGMMCEVGVDGCGLVWEKCERGCEGALSQSSLSRSSA